MLRKSQPERKRAFRMPGVRSLPMISVACCLVLNADLPLETWVCFCLWLAIGLAIYSE